MSALVGCQGRADAEPFQTRDSAGVQITESRGPVWTPGMEWRIAEAPLLEITSTGQGGEQGFGQVVGAARLADGGVVVADGVTNQLRFFGADGALLSSWSGPGEAQAGTSSITSLSRLPGDSLILFDAGARRLLRLGPDGVVRGETLLQGESPALDRAGALADGSVVVRSARTVGATEPGVTRPRLLFLRFGRDGALIDTVAVAPGRAVGTVALGPARATVDPPLGPLTLHALHGDQLYLGTGELFEVRVYGSDGALRRLLRVPGADLSVPPGELEAARAERRSMGRGNPVAERLMEQLERAIPDPTTRPAYAEVLVDGLGNVWVGEYPRLGPGGFPPRTARTWTVFDAEGPMLGTVQAPEGVRLIEVGDDYVLGARWNANGTECVLLFSLTR